MTKHQTVISGAVFPSITQWAERPSRFFTSFYASGEGKGTVITNIQALRLITAVTCGTAAAVLWQWLGGVALTLLCEASAWGVLTLAVKGGRA